MVAWKDSSQILVDTVAKKVVALQRTSTFRRTSNEMEKLLDSWDPAQTLAISAFLAMPLIGFVEYPVVANFLRGTFEAFVSFQSVDGNAFAADLLRPTVNGVIVPACAITFGTLLATTVNVLRNRQVEMRACISKEACQLRLLRRAIFGMFGTAQHARRRQVALGHLLGYTEVCVKETTAGAFDELDSQKEAGGSLSINELEEIAAMLHGVDGAAASRDFSVSSAQTALVNLNTLRSDRLASLLSGFPVVHWMILALLSSSIVLLFLIDSNQDVLQYLNSLQLRLLFAILLATFAATGLLCLDLADPFRGVTTINSEGEQFRQFHRTIEADLAAAKEDIKEYEARTGRVARVAYGTASDQDPQHASLRKPVDSWGLVDTVYFHALTGKPGSTVRLLGDVVAWTGRHRPRLRRRRRAAAEEQEEQDGPAPPQTTTDA